MKNFLLAALLALQYMCTICAETQPLPEPYRSIYVLPYDGHHWFAEANKRGLQEIMTKYQPNIIVELGSWLGYSAIYMASMMPEAGRLYAVDNWIAQSDFPGGRLKQERASRLPTLYQQFLSNVIHADMAHKIVPMRMNTREAAKALNIKVDLVYVDAGHDEESVYNDIMDWFPKLNEGGTMCGDDWSLRDPKGVRSTRKGVIKAAEELGVTIKTIKRQFWYFERLAEPGANS